MSETDALHRQSLLAVESPVVVHSFHRLVLERETYVFLVRLPVRVGHTYHFLPKTVRIKGYLLLRFSKLEKPVFRKSRREVLDLVTGTWEG